MKESSNRDAAPSNRGTIPSNRGGLVTYRGLTIKSVPFCRSSLVEGVLHVA